MKRTERINFWLGDKDLAEIDRRAKEQKCSRSELIRRIIQDMNVLPTPDVDYGYYESEFCRLGNALNDIVRDLNTTGILDKEALEDVWREIEDLSKWLLNELIEKTERLEVKDGNGKK